ncbi:fluoride efflux transporter FluC [Nocardiopsis sp. NPDC055551]
MTPPAPARLRSVLAFVALGGALGALTRHGLDTLWPPTSSGVSWTILAVNVTGSLLIGLLMELIAHRWLHSRYVRPFWGVGFLGGYTTFSAYATDVVTALERGAPQVALAYLSLTLVGALTATWAASALAHRLLTHGGGRNP